MPRQDRRRRRRPGSGRRTSGTRGGRGTARASARGGRRCRGRWWRGRIRAASGPGLPTAPRRAAGPPANDSVSGADMNRRQRSWALRSQACLEHRSRGARTRRGATRGNAVEVEERDRVVAGVVAAADEDRRRRESSMPRSASRSRTRGSLSICGHGPGVRPAGAAAAGAAVVGRVVRIVQAVRAVPERATPAGRNPTVRPMSRSSRSAMSAISSTREADVRRSPGRASARCAPVAAASDRRRLDELAGRCGECGPSAAETGRGRPAGSRPATPTPAVSSAPPAKRAAADVELVRGRAQDPARLGPAPMRSSSSDTPTSSIDPVLRANDDRAERHEVGVGRAAVVHRHAEEAGRAEGLRIAAAISSRCRRNDSSRSSRQQTT